MVLPSDVGQHAASSHLTGFWRAHHRWEGLHFTSIQAFFCPKACPKGCVSITYFPFLLQVPEFSACWRKIHQGKRTIRLCLVWDFPTYKALEGIQGKPECSKCWQLDEVRVQGTHLDFLDRVWALGQWGQLSSQQWILSGGGKVFRPKKTVLPLGNRAAPPKPVSCAHCLALLLRVTDLPPGLSPSCLALLPGLLKSGCPGHFFFFKAMMVWV